MNLNMSLSLAPIVALIAGVLILIVPRLLNYIVPDVVHVLSKGRIVKTGGKDLAHELEARGYAEYQEEVPA